MIYSYYNLTHGSNNTTNINFLKNPYLPFNIACLYKFHDDGGNYLTYQRSHVQRVRIVRVIFR